MQGLSKARRLASSVALASAVLVAGAAVAHGYAANEPALTITATEKPVNGQTQVTVHLDRLAGEFAHDAVVHLTCSGEGINTSTINKGGAATGPGVNTNSVTTPGVATDHKAVFDVSVGVTGWITCTATAVNLAGETVQIPGSVCFYVYGDDDGYYTGPGDDDDYYTGPGDDGPDLPVTGGEIMLYATGAAILLAVGATLVVGARRRNANA